MTKKLQIAMTLASDIFPDIPWEKLAKKAQERFLSQAIKVLTAMRNPTPEMTKALEDAYNLWRSSGSIIKSSTIFTLTDSYNWMINGALYEDHQFQVNPNEPSLSSPRRAPAENNRS